MYCSKCGVENSDGSTHCVNCGSVLMDLPPQPGVQAVAEAVKPKTSRLAIAAFVMGLCSMTCILWPFLALPAIICGIVALVKISKSNGQLKGTGFAVTGLVIPAVLTIVLPLFLAILMPALSKVKMIAQRVVCESNLKVMMSAMPVYMNDNEGKYPAPEQWCDLLIQEGRVPPTSFCCPLDSDGSFSYAINKNLYTIAPDKMLPDQMVVLFESNLGHNGVGGPEDLALRHSGDDPKGCNVSFADGHVEFVTEDRIGDLQWTAE